MEEKENEKNKLHGRMELEEFIVLQGYKYSIVMAYIN